MPDASPTHHLMLCTFKAGAYFIRLKKTVPNDTVFINTIWIISADLRKQVLYQQHCLRILQSS